MAGCGLGIFAYGSFHDDDTKHVHSEKHEYEGLSTNVVNQKPDTNNLLSAARATIVHVLKPFQGGVALRYDSSCTTDTHHFGHRLLLGLNHDVMPRSV